MLHRPNRPSILLQQKHWFERSRPTLKASIMSLTVSWTRDRFHHGELVIGDPWCSLTSLTQVDSAKQPWRIYRSTWCNWREKQHTKSTDGATPSRRPHWHLIIRLSTSGKLIIKTISALYITTKFHSFNLIIFHAHFSTSCRNQCCPNTLLNGCYFYFEVELIQMHALSVNGMVASIRMINKCIVHKFI